MAVVPKSNLIPYEKQIAYTMFLRPQIAYPFPCLKLSKPQLKQMFRPVLDEILHTLNLSKKFPLDVVHGGSDFFGLEVDDPYHLKSTAQMKFFLGHTNIEDTTGDLIKIAVDYIELISGIGGSPLQHLHVLRHSHIPSNWVTSLAKYLHEIGGTIEMWRKLILFLQRENDQYIMQIAIDGRFDLQLIQQ